MKKYMHIEFLEALQDGFEPLVVYLGDMGYRVWGFYTYVHLYSLNVS